MTTKTLTTFLFIITAYFFSAQSYDWQNISKNFQKANIHENFSEKLSNIDSIDLAVFIFEAEERIDLNNTQKQKVPSLKINYSDLKQKLSLEDSKLKLHSKSKYLLKYEAPKTKLFEYRFYFLNSISKDEISKFKKYLLDHFSILKIEFISKDEAAHEAKNTLGINSEELFEESIFPASISIQTETKLNLKKIKNQFKHYLDDATDENPEVETLIFRIET